MKDALLVRPADRDSVFGEQVENRPSRVVKHIVLAYRDEGGLRRNRL